MKTKFYLFAALCCVMMSVMPKRAAAESNPKVQVNGIYYQANKNTIGQVVRHTSGEDNYNYLQYDCLIRSSVDKVGPIKVIAPHAFEHMKGKEVELYMQNSLEMIGEYAFADATGLRAIELDNTISYIGENAFAGCTNLNSVNIPTSLTELPNRMFLGCESLGSIKLPIGVKKIGASAFEGCKSLISVNDEDNRIWAEEIGSCAFKDCEWLKKIHFSVALRKMKDSAFRNCRMLYSLELPANLEEIGDWCFADCKSLRRLTVYNPTPVSIKANVFDGVDLKQCVLFVPKGCKEAYRNADVWKKFVNISEVGEEIKPIPVGKYKIGDFYYHLNNVNLTATLAKSEEYQAFTGEVTIPSSVICDNYEFTVTKATEYVFDHCEQISSITWPSTITEINEYAMMNCKGLQSVVLPSSLTAIRSQAFQNCDELSSITLPSTLTEIGSYAFTSCDKLGSISIPSGVAVIPKRCFRYCAGLSRVYLREGLKEIDEGAFEGTDLRSITLPASLDSLGATVFDECNHLASIKVLATTPPKALDNTFSDDVTFACILYVPKGTKELYEAADGWKEFATIRETGVNAKIQYGEYGLYYRIYENYTAMVTFETSDENNYKALTGTVVVDETVEYEGAEYAVRSVDANAFANSKNITKIVLPEVMDNIYANAFANMNLFEINIPATLQSLSNTAFKGSALFTTHMDEQGAVYYDGCLLYHEKDYILGPYKVKDGTRLIASYVFSGDTKITQLELPEGVQCICAGAIDYMQLLNTVTIPSTVYSLQDGLLTSYCEKVEVINCHIKEPLNISEINAFTYMSDEHKKNITLYVPYGSSEAYMAAEKWKDFTIVENTPIYNVTFINDDGMKLSEQEVAAGFDAVPPTPPTKVGYHFTGWDKDYKKVESDLIIMAQFEIDKYTVKFHDMNPSVVIKTQQVEYSDAATAPEPPEHTGYHFLYWTPADFDVITSDLDVYAQYEMNTYEVRFEDWDGTELNTFMVDHAHMINLIDMPDESALTRDCYTFYGWKSSADEILTEEDIAAAEVLKDETYTAYYEINKYTVTLDCNNGTIEIVEYGVDLGAVECGTVLHFTVYPDPEYEFDKWLFEYDEEAGYEVTGDATISAQTKLLTFTVTFRDWDEKVLKTQTVELGSAATPPADPEREGYTFTGWDPADFSYITSDLTVTATYSIKTYTVTFVDWDEKVLKTQTVDWNTAATAPEDPEREGYTFTGWDPADFSHVTSDLTVTAQYKENPGTGIGESTMYNVQGTKVLRDGRLYIIVGDRTYDATGRLLR